MSKKLVDYLQEIAPLIGYDDGSEFILNEDLLEQLGVEIYFKQLRVVQIHILPAEYEPVDLHLNGVYEVGESGKQVDWVYLRKDGEFFIEM